MCKRVQTCVDSLFNAFRSTEHEKEELLRNVFRKARQKAKEEMGQQLSEFQVKRQVGLSTLYGPTDHVIARCNADKQQVRLMNTSRLMASR